MPSTDASLLDYGIDYSVPKVKKVVIKKPSEDELIATVVKKTLDKQKKQKKIE